MVDAGKAALPVTEPLVMALGGVARESTLTCTWLSLVMFGAMLVLFTCKGIMVPGMMVPLTGSAA